MPESGSSFWSDANSTFSLSKFLTKSFQRDTFSWNFLRGATKSLASSLREFLNDFHDGRFIPIGMWSSTEGVFQTVQYDVCLLRYIICTSYKFNYAFLFHSCFDSPLSHSHCSFSITLSCLTPVNMKGLSVYCRNIDIVIYHKNNWTVLLIFSCNKSTYLKLRVSTIHSLTRWYRSWTVCSVVALEKKWRNSKSFWKIVAICSVSNTFHSIPRHNFRTPIPLFKDTPTKSIGCGSYFWPKFKLVPSFQKLIIFNAKSGQKASFELCFGA